MTIEISSVHEPEAPVVDVEEVWEDYQRVRALYGKPQALETSISIRVPLWAVLDAIKQMDLSALHQVAALTEQQLALHKG